MCEQVEKPKEKITRSLLAGIRPAVPLLLVIGLALGPFYYGYCVLYSGELARMVEMTERASRWQTADGGILRFANGLAFKPVALVLSPEMNRMMLRLKFRVSESASEPLPIEYQYQASLLQLDHTILERPIRLDADATGVQTVNVGPLEIPYPAEYLFVLEQIGNNNVATRVSLEVIEKVETPAKSIIWTGMGLLFIAAIVSLRDAIASARKVRPR